MQVLLGVDRLIKIEVLGWAHSHLTTSLNQEPNTKSSISGDLKQVQCKNAIGICSEVRITFCSNLHVPHFQRKTDFDEGLRLVPHEKDELLLLLLLHATTSTYYFSFYYLVGRLDYFVYYHRYNL